MRFQLDNGMDTEDISLDENGFFAMLRVQLSLVTMGSGEGIIANDGTLVNV